MRMPFHLNTGPISIQNCEKNSEEANQNDRDKCMEGTGEVEIFSGHTHLLFHLKGLTIHELESSV